MNELKAETIVPQGSTVTLQMYPKAEADKVIAELKNEIEEQESLIAALKEKYNELAKLHDKAIQACCDADKVIRHHKYKRCLAMADYCYTNVHCIMGHRLCALSDRKKEWFERWRKRWLELAKKFKEAK